MYRILLTLLMCAACAVNADAPAADVTAVRTARNGRIKSIQFYETPGARPRWSPDGRTIVFDRKVGSGKFQVFLMLRNGTQLGSPTLANALLRETDNGNAVFHPSGRFIVFLSRVSEHAYKSVRGIGDPGVGLFSNLWASTLDGRRTWKLTNIPIKRRHRDKTKVFASVNPVFSADGQRLVWTERYDRGGNWGRWRLKSADFVVADGTPRLRNERVLFTPSKGNYVTAMGFLPTGELIVSGNLGGQHEYAMDLYKLDVELGAIVPLVVTPEFWEEDASVTPRGRLVYMTNQDSRFQFDFSDPNWAAQRMERDYYLMNGNGSETERLTHFNEPGAPEFVGSRALAVASDVSPDGRFLAATVGIDNGRGRKRSITLRMALIEFKAPL